MGYGKLENFDNYSDSLVKLYFWWEIAKLSVPYSNLAKVERKEDGVERRCGRMNIEKARFSSKAMI